MEVYRGFFYGLVLMILAQASIGCPWERANPFCNFAFDYFSNSSSFSHVERITCTPQLLSPYISQPAVVESNACVVAIPAPVEEPPSCSCEYYTESPEYIDEAPETVYEEEAPFEDAPVVEAPVQEVPYEVAPVEEAPTEKAPAEEVPFEEAPVEEVPAEEAPTEEAPTPSCPSFVIEPVNADFCSPPIFYETPVIETVLIPSSQPCAPIIYDNTPIDLIVYDDISLSYTTPCSTYCNSPYCDCCYLYPLTPCDCCEPPSCYYNSPPIIEPFFPSPYCDCCSLYPSTPCDCCEPASCYYNSPPIIEPCFPSPYCDCCSLYPFTPCDCCEPPSCYYNSPPIIEPFFPSPYCDCCSLYPSTPCDCCEPASCYCNSPPIIEPFCPSLYCDCCSLYPSTPCDCCEPASCYYNSPPIIEPCFPSPYCNCCSLYPTTPCDCCEPVSCYYNSPPIIEPCFPSPNCDCCAARAQLFCPPPPVYSFPPCDCCTPPAQRFPSYPCSTCDCCAPTYCNQPREVFCSPYDCPEPLVDIVFASLNPTFDYSPGNLFYPPAPMNELYCNSPCCSCACDCSPSTKPILETVYVQRTLPPVILDCTTPTPAIESLYVPVPSPPLVIDYCTPPPTNYIQRTPFCEGFYPPFAGFDFPVSDCTVSPPFYPPAPVETCHQQPCYSCDCCTPAPFVSQPPPLYPPPPFGGFPNPRFCGEPSSYCDNYPFHTCI